MRTIATLILLGVTALLSAYSDTSTIDCTIQIFNTEIARQEKQSSSHLLVDLYNERADLNFIKKDFHEALKDYTKALQYIDNNQLSDPSNQLKGICGSLFCYQNLDNDDAAHAEFIKLAYCTAMFNDELENIAWIKNSPFFRLIKKANRFILKNFNSLSFHQ